VTSSPSAAPAGRLTQAPAAVQWLVLLLVSVPLAALFQWLGVPAAFLVAPMLAGIVVSTNGGSVRAPALLYLGAQSVIGSLIAHSVTAEIFWTFLSHWPLFTATIFAILAASSFMGWVMTRLHVLPGTTAVWGTSPGAATPMMLMARAFGADDRLVAFMQYLRVVLVAITAATIAGFWLNPSGAGSLVETHWLAPVDFGALPGTLAVAASGAALGRLLKIPAGGFLVPFFLGSALQVIGLVRIEWPSLLTAASMVVLGWSIGLSFTRAILLHALRAMPQIAAATVILIAFCGLLAWLLHVVVGVDPLTAYLATSPGGIDYVGIIAASTRVDVGFVMALQTFRLVMVLICGPSIARLVARFSERR
jgi:uncharacterized protein